MSVLYIVVQRPRAKYRAGLSVLCKFVEADTKTEAIKKADFVKSPEFGAPEAKLCEAGTTFQV